MSHGNARMNRTGLVDLLAVDALQTPLGCQGLPTEPSHLLLVGTAPVLRTTGCIRINEWPGQARPKVSLQLRLRLRLSAGFESDFDSYCWGIIKSYQQIDLIYVHMSSVVWCAYIHMCQRMWECALGENLLHFMGLKNARLYPINIRNIYLKLFFYYI